MDLACWAPPFITHQIRFWTPIVLTVLYWMIIGFFLKKSIYDSSRKLIKKILLSIVSLISFFFVFVALSIAYFLFIEGDDNPPSARYHELNAIVKLYCKGSSDQLYSSPHMYCPHTEKEVYMAAQENMKELLNNANITYRYFPKTNDYLLIIRNNTYWTNNNRVAIFDSRLPKLAHYGYNTQLPGIDFYDAEIVRNCDGTYTVVNPPPLPGPWNKVN